MHLQRESTTALVRVISSHMPPLWALCGLEGTTHRHTQSVDGALATCRGLLAAGPGLGAQCIGHNKPPFLGEAQPRSALPLSVLATSHLKGLERTSGHAHWPQRPAWSGQGVLAGSSGGHQQLSSSAPVSHLSHNNNTLSNNCTCLFAVSACPLVSIQSSVAFERMLQHTKPRLSISSPLCLSRAEGHSPPLCCFDTHISLHRGPNPVPVTASGFQFSRHKAIQIQLPLGGPQQPPRGRWWGCLCCDAWSRRINTGAQECLWVRSILSGFCLTQIPLECSSNNCSDTHATGDRVGCHPGSTLGAELRLSFLCFCLVVVSEAWLWCPEAHNNRPLHVTLEGMPVDAWSWIQT